MATLPIDSDRPAGWVPLLLQTSDALFPTGAYAHSSGFEEYVRLGLVFDEASLATFFTTASAPMQATFELPFLRYAFAASHTADLNALAELDAEVNASKLARETRMASVQLGTRRLHALRVILPGHPLLEACAGAVRAGTMAGHHVIVCGAQAVTAGVPLEAALGAYYYQAVAAVGGASLKLIRIGQEGVQRALRTAAEMAPAVIARSLAIERADAGWFHPLLEIASMRHEHAAERLFIS